MRRKKEERRGWRKKEREAAPPSSIPSFVADNSYDRQIHTLRPIHLPNIHHIMVIS
jgi:hypothetical protein